jgi:hypothetical protein
MFVVIVRPPVSILAHLTTVQVPHLQATRALPEPWTTAAGAGAVRFGLEVLIRSLLGGSRPRPGIIVWGSAPALKFT